MRGLARSSSRCGGDNVNETEYFLSINLLTSAVALVATTVPNIGWALAKVIPSFKALKNSEYADFLRHEAYDALSHGLAQVEALACLRCVDEGPRGAHFASMAELRNAALLRLAVSYAAASGLVAPLLTNFMIQ